MPYFGDVYIPWITSKDTSITKDIVEKNFVDQPPQVYELTPDLEAGTYSAILNETVHDKNESFEEQQDAVLSMVSRHGTEFPFSVSGDDGYAIVNSATTSIDPRQEIRDADIDLRFLSSNNSIPAVIANPYPYQGGSFDTQTEPHESLVAFPSSISVVNKTPDYTVTGGDGNIDYYIITQRDVVEYQETNLDSQQDSICRLFNSSGERVYSDSRVVDNGSTVDNSLIRITYNSTNSGVEYYDGGWVSMGTVSLPFNDAYTPINKNDEIEIEFINEKTSSVYRGFPAVKYTFSGETSFTFNSDTSVTSISESGYYAHWEDSNGRDIVVVKVFNDGSFYTNSPSLGIQNLSSSNEYELFFGVVPSSIPVDDFARYIYNIGNRQRTFTYISSIILFESQEIQGNWELGYTSNNYNYSITSDHLYGEVSVDSFTPSSEVALVTSNPKNLTGLDEIVVDWTLYLSNGDAKVAIVASDVQGGSYTEFDERFVRNLSGYIEDTPYTDTLDVSNLSGDKYVRLHAYSQDSAAGNSVEYTASKVTIK